MARKMVKVVGTEKSKHLETGKVFEVSEQLAETLIKKGHATKSKAKAEKE